MSWHIAESDLADYAAGALPAQVGPGQPAVRVLAEERKPGPVGQERKSGGVAAEQAGGEHDREPVVLAHQLDARRRGLRVTREEHAPAG